MGFARKIFVAFLLFSFPTWMAWPFCRLAGLRISAKAKIGFSWIWSDSVYLAEGASIGHLNFIAVRRLLLRKKAYIGRLNVIKGPINIVLHETAAIGNTNIISRVPLGISSGPCRLFLGKLTKITANHRVDCTKSIHIGAFSIIGGSGTQLWTHGYIHDLEGPGRYRVDGEIVIENNVYVGSRCFISMGLRIGKGSIIGGGTSVTSDIAGNGLYVSSPVRILSRPVAPQNNPHLVKVDDEKLVEQVFTKPRP